MANRGSGNNPFEQDGPTDYERWNYVVGQAHGQLIVSQARELEMFVEQFKEHLRQHEMANREVLKMPVVAQTEKPS